MARRGRKVYVAYAKKWPYLPIAVADTARELAVLVGTTKNAVDSAISHAKKNGVKNPKYAAVGVDEAGHFVEEVVVGGN